LAIEAHLLLVLNHFGEMRLCKNILVKKGDFINYIFQIKKKMRLYNGKFILEGDSI